MDNFNLRSAYRGSNNLERYDCFDVQCDDMYCYTITTDNEICLMQWIVRLFSLTFPNSGKRLKVSMDMIWDQSVDDHSFFIPVALQFCYEHFCIIYHVSPPQNFPIFSLESFLNHDYVDFFGFQMLYKVRYLRQQYNLVVKNWFDISCQVCLSTPAFLRNHDVSVPLQTLVSVIFSKKYLKPDDILQSNWRLRELSLDKIMFATLDCFFVYKIANLITFPLPL
ncbi:hypothetical protein POPTR_016G028600v4 [Populus trichocarpa]|uniref:Uncharacterized protein n=1 Tax=Populus trichocarpa TaxID=3694 RepID=A0ACC0RSG5_POPTR|nr:hypothetical protein BDE02_16G026000 [Populus trichocarpa]KAI9380063.1 hypothetical protein POPTR_016G028600v4 [Populus trichocarpa]